MHDKKVISRTTVFFIKIKDDYNTKITNIFAYRNLTDNIMTLHRYCLILVFLFAITSCADNSSSWQNEASGVWKFKFGTPEKVTLTSELGIRPKFDAINAMEDAPFPLDENEITFQTVDGKTYIRFPLEEGEKIFGLGLNFKTVEQRGRIMRLHVDHYDDTDNGRTHAPVPFFISSKGYGAFINSARYIDVYCGTGVTKDSKHPAQIMDRGTDDNWSASPYSDNLEFLIPAQGVEVVLFSGKTMLDVVRRFNLYNGGGVLPPKWGLGFWHRVPMRYSAQEIKDEVAEFRKRNFPLTVIGLEPGWQSSSYPCTYEWNKDRFPDPAAFVRELEEDDVEVNLWMNPGIHPKSTLGGEIEPFTGSHTEWCGLIPDYTLPQAQEIVRRHWEKNHLDIGVSGYKMDENDGYDNWIFPDVATFPSGTSAEQLRQIYGSLLQSIQMKMFHDRNLRTYGLVRAGNGGTSSFPFVIYNDYYDHRGFITALINSSFIGTLWTPEVRSSDTSEEWLRRMQTVCFSPLAMLNAWSDGTKPWSFPDVEKQVNDISVLRMRLIPYLYSAFAEYCFEGTPVVRAMNLVEGYSGTSYEEAGTLDATDNPYALAIRHENKDQFMVGDNLLVAPLFTGETQRDVILPQGKWFDFYTGEYAGEGEVITVTPGLDKIPVYVRDGGIIPLFPAICRIDGSKQPLEILHYGTKPSTFRLYDDDGKTFDYEKGDYTYLTISVDKDPSGDLKGIVSVPEGAPLWSFNEEYSFRFMTDTKDTL